MPDDSSTWLAVVSNRFERNHVYELSMASFSSMRSGHSSSILGTPSSSSRISMSIIYDQLIVRGYERSESNDWDAGEKWWVA